MIGTDHNGRFLAADWHATPEELQTQLLPYLPKTRARLGRPGESRRVALTRRLRRHLGRECVPNGG